MSIEPAKSAYTLYSLDREAQFKQAGDSLSTDERTKAIAEGWRTLPSEERDKYESLASDKTWRFDGDSREQVAHEDEDDDDDEFTFSRRTEAAYRLVDPSKPNGAAGNNNAKTGKSKQPRNADWHSERTALSRVQRDANVARERAELQERAAIAASARLQYLLSQSDIFAHFGVAKDHAAAPKLQALHKKRGLGRSESKRRESQANDDGDKEAGVGPPILLSQPVSITGELRPYQLEGLNWMIRLDHHGVNGILADEMGLGKTLQCISMLAWLAEARDIRGPHLVLAPKSTLGNWIGEFTRWCPDALRAVRFHGTKSERKEFVENVLKPGVPSHTRDWDVVVATYEVANAERTHLEKIAWRFVIIDEAHRIKNEASVFARTARALRSDRRLLVTGTPLQNNLHELWALLNFLLPDVFASSEQFDEWFNLDVDDADAKRLIISQLHKLLRPFVLRRLKSDVEKSLPPKTETILFTGLSVKQKEVYKSLLKRDASLLLSGGDGSEPTTASRTAISNIAMQLRKCCNHPYLFQGVEDRTLPPLGEHVVENSGKLKLLDKLLIKLKSRGHRVLIFSQMTQLLDILEDFMHMRGYQYCRIDGHTSYDDRDELIEAYNAPESTKFVFLLSTRAGGLGINLQTADTCVLYDSDWNPQADLQAMDRCHRIGQTREVHVYRLVTANTIEEKIVERAHKKLKLDFMVVQQCRLGSGASTAKQGPSKDEMLEAVKFGAAHIFRSDENEVTDEDIDQILDRGRQKTKAFMDKIQEASQRGDEDLLDFRLDGEATGVQEFEGVDYSKAANRASAAVADHEALTQLVLADMDNDKRERPRAAATYNVTLLSNGGVDRAPGRRNPVPVARRLPKLDDWQFFDKTRLGEIARLEEDAYAKLETAGDTAALEEAREHGALSAELEQEKAALLAAGFSSWTKARFRDWVKEMARHGRDNHAAIAQGLVALGHSDVDEAESRRYAEAFWNRGRDELTEAEWEKAQRTIVKGEKAIEQNAAVRASLRRYIDASGGQKRVLDRGVVDASSTAQNTDDFERPFSRAEDRWLLCAADAAGEAEPDGDELLAAAGASTDRFLFDYFMLSREPKDLAARAAMLAKRTDDFRAFDEKETKARAAKIAAANSAIAQSAAGDTVDQLLRQLDENDKAWARAAADDAEADRRVTDLKNVKAKQTHSKSVAKPNPAAVPSRPPPTNVGRAIVRPPSTPFVAYVADKAASLLKAEHELRSLADRDAADVANELVARLESKWFDEPDDIRQRYAAKCQPGAMSRSDPLHAEIKRDTSKSSDFTSRKRPFDRRDDDEEDSTAPSIPKKRPPALTTFFDARDDDDFDEDSRGQTTASPKVPKKKHRR